MEETRQVACWKPRRNRLDRSSTQKGQEVSTYSYQSLESRLRSVEDLILFIANAVRVPAKVSALDPTPKMIPVGQLYSLVRGLRNEIIDAEATPVVEEPKEEENG